ncbi:MAG TPA: quinoprotein dehydrogenase-associated SoxYZ-like carrier [Steroidobacteraceae bacterium]|nr:quinoprotein dehydrogenase-associated SoxYZ-like carrier [Steroidobacteraceae bacterium]
MHLVRVGRLLLLHGVLGVLAAASGFGSASANEKAEPDPAKSTYWEPIRNVMFGDREISEDRDVIRVYLALRADDASTVPVAVKAQIDQKPGYYIKTIYLVVERNPSPTAGVFHFTLDSGRAQVETRLRFEDFSHVRAIAETSDGKLHMDSRWVKAAGGCSAPNAGNVVPANLLGRIKFKFEDESLRLDEPNLVQLMIRHPNESALAGDFDRSKTPQFVRRVSVTYAGRLVMSAEVDFSISDNPSFRFFFVPHGQGELRAEVEDTYDRLYTQTLRIAAGVPLPGG